MDKTNKILEEIIKEFYSKNEKIKKLKLENKNKLNEINKSNYAQIWKISMINKWIIEITKMKTIIIFCNTSWNIYNFRKNLINNLLKNYNVITISGRDM